MDIFHWVANELKDEPLFSSAAMDPKERIGAVYNDFDNEIPFQSDDEAQLEFSFTQPESPTVYKSAAIGQEDVDTAILSENAVINFDIEEFDCYSEYPDRNYREKVYKLLKFHTRDLKIDEEIDDIYRKRKDSNWQGADTVYDMWLLGQRGTRDWFPIEVFEAEYPDYEEIVDKVVEEFEELEKERDDGFINSGVKRPRRKRPRLISETDENEENTSQQSSGRECSSKEKENYMFEIKNEVNEIVVISDSESE